MNTTRKKSVAAIAALLIIAGGPRAVAADSLSMRYGFTPRSAYNQTITLQLATSLPSDGMAGLLKSIMGDVSEKIEMHASLQTQAAAADKSLPFSYRVLDAQGSWSHGGQTKPISSIADAAKKPPVPGAVDADRRHVALTPAPDNGMDRIADLVPKAFPPLPEGGLLVGQSFESKTTLAVPAGGKEKEKKADVIWIFTLKSLDAKEAVFDVTQKIPPVEASSAQEQSVAVSGGGSGRAVWNRADGQFSSVHMNMDLTVDADVPLPAGVTLGGAPAGSRVHTRVTGPLDLTLARTQTSPVPPK